MIKKENNYAFIDSQNLNLGIRRQGWILDFLRFRVYLREKYKVSVAFLFIGYREENKKLYEFLSRSGYVCVFKPTVVHADGTIKGNCDAELVLQVMIELPHFDNAVIVSGDGDFYCLINHLIALEKLESVIIPNRESCSSLLRRDSIKPYLRFTNNLRDKLGR